MPADALRGRVHAPWAWPSRRGSRSASDSRCRPSGRTTGSPSACRRATAPGRHRGAAVPRAGRGGGPGRGAAATSALFASRFRENAARALLLPRRRPGTRTPLWQQRQRAADLLAVASRYGSFPILVETYRECLGDVFDLPALREILTGVARREIAVHSVETARSSPFASSLLFDYVAAYMYDGDAPLAERRAGALTLDRDLLRELLGQEELRELLDPEALADLELSLQALVDDRRATTSMGSTTCCADSATWRPRGGGAARRARGGADPPRRARRSRRVVRVRIAGEERWIAVEDVARYRDAVGVRRRRASPGRSWRRRSGRWRAPGTLGPDPWAVPLAGAGPSLGTAGGIVEDALERLPGGGISPAGRVPPRWRGTGVVRPGRPAPAAPPVPGAAAPRGGAGRPGGARAVPADVARGRRRRGLGSAARRTGGSAALERLAEVVEQLAGLPIPASVLERDILPARIPGYQPRLLDELGALGEVAWVGQGPLGRDDGRIALFRPGREVLRPTGPADGVERPTGPIHERSANTSVAVARPSIESCRPRPAGARTVRCSMRCGTWSGPARSPTTRSRRCGRCAGSGPGGGSRRPRAGRLTALGPPEAAGRWSLVEPVAVRRGGRRRARAVTAPAHAPPARSVSRPEPGPAGAARRPDPRGRRVRRHRWWLQRRLPRPAGDGGGRPDPARLLRGGSGCGPVRARRARWIACASGTARRAGGGPPSRHLLAATDPANPYGAALPWPRRGETTGGRSSAPPGRTSCSSMGPRRSTWSAAAPRSRCCRRPTTRTSLVARCARWRPGGGRAARELVIGKVDGVPVATSPHREALLAAGFVQGYRGYALRAVAPPDRAYPRPGSVARQVSRT